MGVLCQVRPPLCPLCPLPPLLILSPRSHRCPGLAFCVYLSNLHEHCSQQPSCVPPSSRPWNVTVFQDTGCRKLLLDTSLFFMDQRGSKCPPTTKHRLMTALGYPPSIEGKPLLLRTQGTLVAGHSEITLNGPGNNLPGG